MAFDDKRVEIRDRIRLEDLVRDYNVALQPAGGGRFKGLCPFHNEKTPSFHVNADAQVFHCFGCKAGGDIFTFVQKSESVSFPEALEMLARRAGVILEPRSGRGGGAKRGEKNALYDALEFAQEHYHKRLLDDPRAREAREYLDGRGIQRETWERFKLGYSLPDWDGLLKAALAKGIKQDVLEKAGLVRQSQKSGSNSVYDYFRGRVMFPIADGQKRVIGFGARTLGDDQPKYLNTPGTPLFDKSQVLYALPQSRSGIEREKRLAIAEGYTDAIAAHQAGLDFFVASLGTAFTQENAKRLRRLAPRVDLIFDGDFAGQSAAERSLSLLVKEDLDVRIFTLDAGEDPFDSIMRDGGERFRQRLDDGAVGIFEFKWRRTLGSLETGSDRAGDKARALDDVLDLLMLVPNVVARKLYTHEFAERLGIEADDIEKRLRKKSSSSRPFARGSDAPAESRGGVDPAVASDELLSVDNPTLEEVILETLLAEPDRAMQRWSELPADVFADPVPATVRSVAAAIGTQLQEGALDLEPLIRLLESQEAVPVLTRILARIEREAVVNSSSKWNLAMTTDDTWERCLRDLERKSLQRRRQQLMERKARARSSGSSDELLAAEREYCEVLRALARTRESRPLPGDT